MSGGRQQDTFRFDLFVSYASADNHPMRGSGPWVSQLVARLKLMLEIRMGTAPRVWFDWSPEAGATEARRRALEESALLVAILSPAYVQSDECVHELEAFVESAGADRVVKVVKSAVSGTSLLGDSPSYEFFRQSDDRPEHELDNGSHVALDQELIDKAYYVVLNQLVSQVRFLLASLAKATPATAPRQAKMEVFLCHSSGDKATVRSLWEKLKEDGFAPWLDEKELLPGQRWELEIQKAIDRAGAIIVCLSRGSVNKEGFLQREIRLVLDKAAEMPEDSIFLIPARLEECTVPRRLSELQWVDLFEEAGYARLNQALGMRARQVLDR